MINAVLVFNNNGQPRLTKFYTQLDTATQQSLLSQIFALVSARPAAACNFLPLPPLLAPNSNSTSPDVPTQITYRHYATLYFILISTSTESPLALLDFIQVFVEALDRLFENVCELDLIFGFETLHLVLGEMIIGGVVTETSLDKIVDGVRLGEAGSGRRKAVNARDSATGALRDRSKLKYEIIGIVGAYLVCVTVSLFLILVIGKRLRRRTQTSNRSLKMEMLKTASDSLQVPPGPKSPGKMASLKSWATGGRHSHKKSDATISSVDEKVVDMDRQRNMEEMTNLYAVVMAHDVAKPRATQSHNQDSPVSPQTPASPVNTTQRAYPIPTPPMSPQYPPEFQHLRSAVAQAQLAAQPLPPPPPIPPTIVDDRSVTTSRASTKQGTPLSASSGKNSRSGSSQSTKPRPGHISIRGLPISRPMGSADLARSANYSDEMPLSPRLYNPGPPPPTPGKQKPAPVEKSGEPEAPRRRLPAELSLSGKLTPNSSATSLPFRDLYGGVPATPYSPYTPFTPMTPITPRLLTKKEMRKKRKEDGLAVLSEDDMVKSDEEIPDPLEKGGERMMPLTVLTDDDVKKLLLALTKDEVYELQGSLAEALHSYSSGDPTSPCCSSFQPLRTVIKKDGVTTLFMPASTGDTVGMKIVSVETPEASKKASVSSASGVSSPSLSSGISGLTLTPASTFSATDSNSDTSFVPPPSVASRQSTVPKGIVTILDQIGNPIGIINAEELTAFRTALAATIMLLKRQNVHTVTVFGAGKQAFWHIRLALLFKGDEIRHINIINRSFERTLSLMKAFQIDNDARPQWRKDIKFSALSPDFGEYGRLLKDEVRKADVIFCCTPSTEPLFPSEFLTSREGQKKGRYISAIGSYTPHMIELHPDIFKQAVVSNHHRHHHKHAITSGVIIVDTIEGCLKEAGEIIQAQLKAENLVEIGELMMIKKSVHHEIEVGGEGEKGLVDWLVKGNVLYKSVGLGLMDLAVGGDLVILPNGQVYIVTPVFSGYTFKSTNQDVHHSAMPPGWTVVLQTQDEVDVVSEDFSRKSKIAVTSPTDDDTTTKTTMTVAHRFTRPTLQNDYMFISSISMPSSSDFKGPTSPTRYIALMLWATLYWYFHKEAPNPHLKTEASARTPESGRPKAEWRIKIKREGIFKGKNHLQKLERMGLIASEDSCVGTDTDIRFPSGWSNTFVSQKSFWQIDAKLFLFTLMQVQSSPFPAQSPFASRPSSPDRTGDGATRPSPRPTELIQASGILPDGLSAGLASPGGPFNSGSHLPTYYPPPPTQFTFTNHIRHPIRPKPPRQGEVFYTRYIPSLDSWLSFRLGVGPRTTFQLSAGHYRSAWDIICHTPHDGELCRAPLRH
ncbi:hypothetical protein DV737_g4170, partial [Chaetothyriales sp. CBS 132003]